MSALSDELLDIFRRNGLESLASVVLSLTKENVDDATFSLRL